MHHRFLCLAVCLGLCANTLAASPPRKPLFKPVWIQSAKSGPWSKPSTWVGGKVPAFAARVQVRPDHRVVYDVSRGPAIRMIHVAGTLSFARDRDTRLDVGLIRVQPGNHCGEEGFACDAEMPVLEIGAKPPTLEVGTATHPIPAKYEAIIRLVYFRGMNPKSLPALVCCSGKMDLHGAPMNRTWVRLGSDAGKGDSVVTLSEQVTGWQEGDRLLITATEGAFTTSGTRRPGPDALDVGTEERVLRSIDGKQLTLDRPLRYAHSGTGDFRGAVANLSRNVVVESADPQGVRGHTMYHEGSQGAISYAEFRHLGKEGVLGRYAIHFHLVGNTMRGSYVLGASIWDSHNRWITIHGTNYMVVRDCVGYRSVGHGFFLEDGTEIYNVLDRNLAVQAFVGEKLPKQALPFDPNDGAGFWWANSLNTFTRNFACENDRYGYRFEATPISRSNLLMPILQPDGNKRLTDIRRLPFVRFDGNESCCNGKYGFNLGEGVERVGPDVRHPFIIRHTKIWQEHYAFRPQSPSVLVDGMKIASCGYGVYHPNYDHHVYKNLYIKATHSEPFNRGHDDDDTQYGPLTVDGLTFDGQKHNHIPLIQLTGNNPTGRAVAHFRDVRIKNRKDDNRRALVNRGGGPREDPTTARSVPVYLHDYFGKGRDAKIVSILARELRTDGLRYRSMPPLTGDASRVAEAGNIAFPKLLQPVDDLPPQTVITHAFQTKKGTVVIRGTAADNGSIRRVVVNKRPARALRPNFAEWELIMTGLGQGQLFLTAHAEDQAGNIEKMPHKVELTVK